MTRSFLHYWNQRDFGVDLRIASVLRRGGVWRGDSPGAFDPDAFDYMPGADPFDGVDLVIEALPGVYPGGEPATTLLKEALVRGVDVITVNKGPLLAAHMDLAKLARESGARFRYSVGGSLPLMDTALRDLRGTTLLSMRAILNGTTNLVLTEMEAGRSMEEALQSAIEQGIAEPDPSQDLDGIDTAVKMIILVNTVTGQSHRLEDVRIEGIRSVDPRVAITSGRSWKLVGFYDREGIRVGLRLYGKDDLFYSVRGAERIVEFDTEEMGRMVIMGGPSGRTEMSAAIARDILNMYLEF